MTLVYEDVTALQTETPNDAWKRIFDFAWQTCSPSIDRDKAHSVVAARDRAVGEMDLMLTSACWDLWQNYEASVPRTADVLAEWWAGKSPGRAVLILDALSLREVPWIIDGAKQRGMTVHRAEATGAELPADTTPMAKALGFGQRSSLQNNGASGTHCLIGARTETTDIAWEDCAAMIGAEPDWCFWHHWPDKMLHDYDDAGEGMPKLVESVATRLTADPFWTFVSRLAEGRRLVITSDHGYAASGSFPDASKEQTAYLKERFGASRWSTDTSKSRDWTPPIDLVVASQHGENLFVNGRRKWKSQGGHPTLTHGGLSVLEVAVPFIEISKD